MRETELIVSGVPENAAYSDAARIGSLTALEFEGAEGSICIELTNDETIHRFNMEWRGVDRPTDVLSFPSAEGEDVVFTPDGHLGDIMISVETAARQAAELGHSTEREIMFLAVHGTLHVLGYDHMVRSDEEKMTAKQREIISAIEAKA